MGDLGTQVGSYYCSYYGAANPFIFLCPVSRSSIWDPALSPLVACKHQLLHSSDTGRASQETAILGSSQLNLDGIYNSVWVKKQYMGWIPTLGSLRMAFQSVSAPYFVSVSPPMGILIPPSKKVPNIHTMVFLPLELHVVCELYLVQSEL